MFLVFSLYHVNSSREENETLSTGFNSRRRLGDWERRFEEKKKKREKKRERRRSAMALSGSTKTSMNLSHAFGGVGSSARRGVGPPPLALQRQVHARAHRFNDKAAVVSSPASEEGKGKTDKPVTAINVSMGDFVNTNKIAAAGLAAMIASSPLSGAAIASEFDVLEAPAPETSKKSFPTESPSLVIFFPYVLLLFSKLSKNTCKYLRPNQIQIQIQKCFYFCLYFFLLLLFFFFFFFSFFLFFLFIGYVIDDGGILSKSGKRSIAQRCADLEKKTGYHLNVVTMRKLQFTPDPFEFSDKVLETWYPTIEQGDRKGVLVVVSTGKEGSISGGPSFINNVGNDILDSVISETIPVLTTEEKYNEATLKSVQRIASGLEGKADPGAPKVRKVK